MPTFTFCQASDSRWLVIGVVDAKNWRALCQLIGHREWVDDERFATAAAYSQHSDEMEALIEEQFAWCRPRRLVASLTRGGHSVGCRQRLCLCQGVRAGLGEWLLTEIPDARYGGVRRVTGLPWRFSRTPGAVQGGAPELNADADSILSECGYSVDESAALRASGVLPD